MLVKPLSKYVKQVESAFNVLTSGYLERYEEEDLTPERVNLSIRLRFPNGHLLEWNEAVIAVEDHVKHLAYRYHCQDMGNNLPLCQYK